MKHTVIVAVLVLTACSSKSTTPHRNNDPFLQQPVPTTTERPAIAVRSAAAIEQQLINDTFERDHPGTVCRTSNYRTYYGVNCAEQHDPSITRLFSTGATLAELKQNVWFYRH